MSDLLETVRTEVVLGEPLFLHLPEVEPQGETWHAVEPLGRIGPEVWLSALAWGASAVILVQSEGLLRHTQDHLSREMAWVNALLEGLGYGRRIFWSSEGGSWPDRPLLQPPARFPALEEPREQLWLAVEALLSESGAYGSDREIPLPTLRNGRGRPPPLHPMHRLCLPLSYRCPPGGRGSAGTPAA